jgi:hypothetical protein
VQNPKQGLLWSCGSKGAPMSNVSRYYSLSCLPRIDIIHNPGINCAVCLPSKSMDLLAAKLFFCQLSWYLDRHLHNKILHQNPREIRLYKSERLPPHLQPLWCSPISFYIYRPQSTQLHSPGKTLVSSQPTSPS